MSIEAITDALAIPCKTVVQVLIEAQPPAR
jgi:hypothetical protein